MREQKYFPSLSSTINIHIINEDSFFFFGIFNTTNRRTLWVQHENPHTHIMNPHTYLLLQDREGVFALSFYSMCFQNTLDPKIRKMVSHLPCCSCGRRVALERLQTLLTSRGCVSALPQLKLILYSSSLLIFTYFFKPNFI